MEVFVRRFKRYIKGKKGTKARSLFKPVRCSRVQRSREKRCVMCLGKSTSETLTAYVLSGRGQYHEFYAGMEEERPIFIIHML